MKCIRVLSDDEALLRKARTDLERLGYQVEASGVRAAREDREHPSGDLILVDLSSAPPDQESLPAALRDPADLKGAPLIAILSKSQARKLDPAKAADDFIVAPWEADELDARIRVALWRASKTDNEHALRVGDLVINLANFEVIRRGQRVDLTYKEFELLRFLTTHKERVHTRDTLLDQVWGYDYFGGTRTVDVHVRRIRTKIGDSDGELIQTVRNVGYRLTERSR